jgi:hypothetical protein
LTARTGWITADRGWGGGSEFRYAASKESDGVVKGYFTNDQLIGNGMPWKVICGRSFRTWRCGPLRIISAASITSRTTPAVFARRLADQYPQGLTRNWSYYTLNVLGEYAEKLKLQHFILLPAQLNFNQTAKSN